MIERVLPLEVEDGVHDVLEGLGAGDAAPFRDVPDDEDGRAALLREAHQSRRALADLPDVARRPFEIAGVDGLNGVHDEDGGSHRRRRGEDRLEVRLAEEADVAGGVVPQAVGAQLHLQRALLAGRVEGRMSRPLQPAGDLEQQRGFADARLAADEDHRARDDAAAEDEVELVDPRLPAARLGAAHVAQARGGGDAAALGQGPCAAGATARSARRRGLRRHLLDEGVPRTAHVAAAGPLRVVGAAVAAAVDGPGLRAHGRKFTPRARIMMRRVRSAAAGTSAFPAVLRTWSCVRSTEYCRE